MLSGLLCISLRSSDLRALCGPIQSCFIFQREKKTTRQVVVCTIMFLGFFLVVPLWTCQMSKVLASSRGVRFWNFQISVWGFFYFFFGKHADVVDERILWCRKTRRRKNIYTNRARKKHMNMNSQCSRQMKVMTQSQLKGKQKISMSIQSILVDSLFALSWTKKNSQYASNSISFRQPRSSTVYLGLQLCSCNNDWLNKGSSFNMYLIPSNSTFFLSLVLILSGLVNKKQSSLFYPI